MVSSKEHAVRSHLTDPNRDDVSVHNFSKQLQSIDIKSCEVIKFTVYSDRPHLILHLGVQHYSDISGFE